MTIKSEASSQGQEYLSWNDIQNCIDMANVQIQEENDSKYFLQSLGSKFHPVEHWSTPVGYW